MNKIQIFKNEQFGEIRTIEENGKVLFCGADVAKALGYAKSNNAILSHCKGIVKRRTLTNGGEQEMSFITEGDIYRLIAHSRLPTAKTFENWVFDEVLPAKHKATNNALREDVLNMDEAQIQVFKNEQFGKIRTMDIDGEPWFVGKDVAEILGYSNTRDALCKHVDKEDRNTVAFCDGNKGNPNQTVINESGLYSLILSSKLSTAKEFKHWVTSEVLPSIRKHGAYMTDATIEKLVADPDLIIELATQLKQERTKSAELTATVAIQNQQIAEMKPKVSYYDIVLNCPDLLPITEIAKDYGKSAKWLNKILCEQKIQFKQSGMWLLYQKYAENGYTQSKTATYKANDGDNHTKLYTCWTQKGRLFIYDTLKSLGYLPIIEQE